MSRIQNNREVRMTSSNKRKVIFATLITMSIAYSNAYAINPSTPCSSMEAMLSGKENLLKNQKFVMADNGPKDWQLSPGIDYLQKIEDDTVLLTPNSGLSASLQQEVILQPATLYTASICVKGNSSVPPTFSVSGGVQREKIQSYLERGVQDGIWTLYRFIFYTTSGNVRFNLSGYKNDLGQSQAFKYPALVKGRLPAPIPELPKQGENMVLNPSFSNESRHWVFDRDSAITKRHCDSDGRCYAALYATNELNARVSQVFGFSLAPNTHYVMQANVRTIEGKRELAKNDLALQGHLFVTIKGVDPSPKSGWFTTNGQWQKTHYEFITGDEPRNVKLMLESYKQPAIGEVAITDIIIKATGKETYPDFGPAPEKTDKPLIEDFQTYQQGQSLNKAAWLLPNKAWGGDNHGVASTNIQFVANKQDGQYLKLNAFGSNTQDENKVRQGSALVTNKYYASGIYLVCARMPKHHGVVSAFWPFHYIAYQPTQSEYWDEPNPIRNTEIDWELPTSNLDNSEPVSYKFARLNTWGGQFGGEGGNDTDRANLLPYNDNRLVNEDNEFHQYGFIWFAGHDNGDGTRTPGFIKWTFNKECYKTPPKNIDDNQLQVLINTKGKKVNEGESYGQDNIPFRAARFWIGAWFPGIADKPYHAGGQEYWGWGGTPDFEQDSLDIKWVGVYPWQNLNKGQNANRDTWVAESAPDAGNWSDGYPVAVGPIEPTPTPDPSTKSIEVQFDDSVANDFPIALYWTEKGEIKSKSISKAKANHLTLNADIGTSIKANDYICWDNHGDKVRDTTNSIFLAMQKTWIKCRLQ